MNALNTTLNTRQLTIEIKSLMAEIEAQQTTYREIIDLHRRKIGELDVEYIHLMDQLEKVRSVSRSVPNEYRAL